MKMNILLVLCLTVLTGSVKGTCVEKCTLCTIAGTQPKDPNPFSAPFQIDVVDTSGKCAVRTSTCVHPDPKFQAAISYFDASDHDIGTESKKFHVSSVLTCNDDMQWVKTTRGRKYVISAIECLHETAK